MPSYLRQISPRDGPRVFTDAERTTQGARTYRGLRTYQKFFTQEEKPSVRFLNGLGAEDRYLPSSGEILTRKPRPGTFYRSRKGITPWHVSKAAYGQENVKAGLTLMNSATWNDQIRKARKGWEAYGVDGLQFDPKYSKAPRSSYRSGSDYPVVWIPPLDGAEPEDLQPKPSPAPSPIPGVPGPRGPSGPRGPGGTPGTPGPQGPGGSPGTPGTPGPRGLIGPSGSAGPRGHRGPVGPPGSANEAAIAAAIKAYMIAHPTEAGAGPPGPRGHRGPSGMPGSIGPRGPRGSIGPPGGSIVGPVGPRGPAGPPGPPGMESRAMPATAVKSPWWTAIPIAAVVAKWL